ncbi:MAG: hypothetical protein OXF56_19235 [Rhodobacteraceae bacterium]|nr:hypothetical protein [Paracoccaceae bacterium]
MAIDVVRELGRRPLRPTPREAREDMVRLVGFMPVEDVGERIAAWNFVPRRHEPMEEIFLDLAVFGHVGTSFAPGARGWSGRRS